MRPEETRRSGDLVAMDHVAQWVRFADVKATILLASLGVVLSLLVGNTGVVVEAACLHVWAAIVGCVLAVGAGILAAMTLKNLVSAIAPRSTVTRAGLNRFAWPRLAGADSAVVRAHAREVDAGAEAWAQTVDLAGIAEKKFAAVDKAVRGLGSLIVVSVVLVVGSILVVGLR